jgi:hypothetical protein
MNLLRLFLLTTTLLFHFLPGFSCSTYKVTVGGTTMYGMNYDTWFTAPRIWFETTGYGAMFTGANFQGGHDLTPQCGMNEYGLSFGTLAAPTPENGKVLPGKKQITSRSHYLKNILHTCKTVQEVKAYIEQYDHSFFSGDVFMYTDPSGHYLIVEPYTLTLGQEHKYVLANFCPSTITDFSTIKQPRYMQGTAFLKDKIDTTLAFCRALSDTMHVCRKRVGDGTLLTSIWDLNKGIVHLYFYHDYHHTVQFNLKQELAKGDHSFEIAPLFPQNAEYLQLLSFKTPMNSDFIQWFLCFCGVLFALSCPFFLVSYVRNRKAKYAPYQLLLAALGLCMAFYMLCLLTQTGIYYFPAPYKHYKPGIIDLAAYLPFVVLLLLIPLLLINRKVFRDKAWGTTSRWLFTLNNFAYLVLIVLFAYWGLFNLLN